MAGSYRHITQVRTGDLISNEEFPNMIENLGDAYEAIEECWYIIQILAQGSKESITRAERTAHQILNHRNRK